MNRLPLIAIALSFIAIGCGSSDDTPELGTVSGTVTLDGNPVPDAMVSFTPKEGGRPSSGKTDESGYYELQYSPSNNGAVPGKHQVRITTATTVASDTGEDVEVAEKIPAQYNAETELIEEVEPGAQTIDFDLKDAE
ncbi:carboxypeptidase-like regulatory domain-containing protein [Thalassoroseus pseudoceratinae]|uniref:carboxypeptidase-like regulatory domain-containing protein n=1 Tax=Thalassoroseus pseudoceratinae TaxID=2713176 RepID=UPI001420CA91|nr:carboxypeptidase-like regulatory domain-containing protein [Thalassoroseus pseudoceratinae]